MKNRKCIKIQLNITIQKWVMYKFNCWLNLCIKFMYKNFYCRIVFAQVTPNLKIIRRLAQVTPARGYLSEAGFLDFWPGNIFRIFYQIPLPGVQTHTHILIFFSDWNKIVFMKFFSVKVENPLKLPQFTVYEAQTHRATFFLVKNILTDEEITFFYFCSDFSDSDPKNQDGRQLLAVNWFLAHRAKTNDWQKGHHYMFCSLG